MHSCLATAARRPTSAHAPHGTTRALAECRAHPCTRSTVCPLGSRTRPGTSRTGSPPLTRSSRPTRQRARPWWRNGHTHAIAWRPRDLLELMVAFDWIKYRLHSIFSQYDRSVVHQRPVTWTQYEVEALQINLRAHLGRRRARRGLEIHVRQPRESAAFLPVVFFFRPLLCHGERCGFAER
jgi:hypothetical protein